MSHCIKEMTLDLKDYIEGGTVFRRNAVRGIVRRKDKYLVIYGKYGDYNFPGGGMKEGGRGIIGTNQRKPSKIKGLQMI